MPTHSGLELALNTVGAKRILQIAKDIGAYLQGDFILSSGKRSSHYFEGKKITLSPEGAYWVGKTIFDELVKIGVDSVGGLTIGADPIATAVSLVSYQEGKPIPAFIVRDAQKEHGTKRRVEGHLKEGVRVAIVDDVITTGGSVFKAIEAVEAVNCKVAAVVVLVDRHEGGSDALRQKGYNFLSILDLWPSGETTVDGSPAARYST